MRKKSKMSFPIHRFQVFEQHFLGICIDISPQMHNIMNLKREQSHNTHTRWAHPVSKSDCLQGNDLLCFFISLWKSLDSQKVVTPSYAGRLCNVTESTMKPFQVKVVQIPKCFRLHIFVRLCSLHSFLYLLLFFSVFVFRNTTMCFKYSHSHILLAVTQQWSHVPWTRAETRSNLIPTDSSRNTIEKKFC